MKETYHMIKEEKTTVTITGPFEGYELATLVALVRFIDGQHPDRHYSLIVDSPTATLAEAEKRLREIVPEVPGRETKFSVHRKQ
jgi:hypothetical protein